MPVSIAESRYKSVHSGSYRGYPVQSLYPGNQREEKKERNSFLSISRAARRAERKLHYKTFLSKRPYKWVLLSPPAKDRPPNLARPASALPSSFGGPHSSSLADTSSGASRLRRRTSFARSGECRLRLCIHRSPLGGPCTLLGFSLRGVRCRHRLLCLTRTQSLPCQGFLALMRTKYHRGRLTWPGG